MREHWQNKGENWQVVPFVLPVFPFVLCCCYQGVQNRIGGDTSPSPSVPSPSFPRPSRSKCVQIEEKNLNDLALLHRTHSHLVSELPDPQRLRAFSTWQLNTNSDVVVVSLNKTPEMQILGRPTKLEILGYSRMKKFEQIHFRDAYCTKFTNLATWTRRLIGWGHFFNGSLRTALLL